IVEAEKAGIEASEAANYSSDTAGSDADAPQEGSLASDEALQALREKLTGGEA
ncbi:MAG: ribosomal protein, partial [Aeromicrobium sp.]|nr:ribosomal protein [Aeromicrobium sp.]MCW2788477.1 ribosomal protein [Aeromicrobium sp.]